MIRKKRPQDDLDAADGSAQKSTRFAEDALCGVCQNIDFWGLFATQLNNRGKQNLGNLTHVFDCPVCPLCRYIAKIVTLRSPELDNLAAYTWEVQQSVLAYEDYLRLTDIAPYYRLQVSVWNQQKGRLVFIELDHCEGYTEYRTADFRMQRRRIKELFDYKLLRRWLDKYDADDRDTRTVGITIRQNRLDPLMSQGRFRLLNVYSGEVIIIRSKARYLALSYVCGVRSAQNVLYHPKNKRSDQVAWCVNLDDLPATLKDAVVLVRELEQEFLWVDTLCIDQDDQLDRAAVISKMEAIYSEAYLTIEAAGGADANAGLLRM